MIRILSSEYIKNPSQYIANIDSQPIAVVDSDGNVIMTIGGLSDPTLPPTYFKGKQMLHLLTKLERQLIENQLSQEWFRDYLSGQIREYAYRDILHARTILTKQLDQILKDLDVEIADFLKEEILQATLIALGLSSVQLEPVKKLTITIEDPITQSFDTPDVEIKVQGQWIDKVFTAGSDSWDNIKGSIHSIIAEMDLGPGKQVTITSVS